MKTLINPGDGNFHRFRIFLLKQKASYLFTPVFYGLLVCALYLQNVHLDIHQTKSFFPSWATAENVDISERVSLLYKGVGIFIAVFAIVYILINVSRKFIHPEERKMADSVSMGACLVLLFKLFGYAGDHTIILLLSVHFQLGIFILLKKLFFGKKYFFPDQNIFFTYSLLISYSLLIFLNSYKHFHHQFIYFNVIEVVLIVVSLVSYRQVLKKESPVTFEKILFAGTPVLFIPLIIVFCKEGYMILNQHSIFSIKIHYLYAFGLLLIAGWIISRTQQKKNHLDKPGWTASFYKIGIPAFLAGMVAWQFYTPIREAGLEMFENANPIVTIQQMYQYGKIPFIDSFNSHALSEIFFRYIYSFFNHSYGEDMFIYDFLFSIIYVLSVYYILNKVTDHPMVSLFIILFTPLAFFLFPPFFSFSIAGAFIVYYIVHRWQSRRLLIGLCLISFMIIWRLDIGFATMLAVLFSSCIYLIVFRDQKTSLSKLMKAVAVFSIGALLVLTLVSLVTAKNILIPMREILDYLSSVQSYGIPTLTYDAKDYIFCTHYILFPLAVIGVFGLMLYKAFTGKMDAPRDRYIFIIFTFAILFYFFNFQRGMVRHSFAEGRSYVLSSFAFFIIAGAVYIFRPLKGHLYKTLVFSISTFLMVTAFYYPREKTIVPIPFEEVSNVIRKDSLFNNVNYKLNRLIIPEAFKEEKIAVLDSFMMTACPKGSTFIDFSNSPMLYYYTGKENPDFFSQPTLSNHSEFLQEQFLKNISRHKTPLVVYSNYPETWYDAVDDIPNPIRHPLIAEYIFRNYKPCYIIGNHCIWIEKSMSVPGNLPKDTYSLRSKCYEKIGYIPLFQASYLDKNIGKVVFKTDGKLKLSVNDTHTFTFNPIKEKEEGNFIFIKAGNYSGKAKARMKMIYGDSSGECGSFIFYMKDTEHSYAIRISSQYNWWIRPVCWVKFMPLDAACDIGDFKITKAIK